MIYKHDLKLGIIYFAGYVTPQSLDSLEHELRTEAELDSDVIVLYIRSPGGYVFRVPETARLIEKITETKPVIAYTDVVLASAAYWLASSCDAIYASPSSYIGSIGAYVEHYNYEGYYKKYGIDHKVFRSGDRKARTLDGQIDDQEIAEIQAGVEATHSQFIEHVLKHRKIDLEHMQGQTFEGSGAFAINMVDGLFDSFDDFKNSFNQGGT